MAKLENTLRTPPCNIGIVVQQLRGQSFLISCTFVAFGFCRALGTSFTPEGCRFPSQLWGDFGNVAAEKPRRCSAQFIPSFGSSFINIRLNGKSNSIMSHLSAPHGTTVAVVWNAMALSMAKGLSLSLSSRAAERRAHFQLIQNLSSRFEAGNGKSAVAHRGGYHSPGQSCILPPSTSPVSSRWSCRRLHLACVGRLRPSSSNNSRDTTT